MNPSPDVIGTEAPAPRLDRDHQVRLAVANSAVDPAVRARFLATWRSLMNLLDACSAACDLPIFGYLNGVRVYESPTGHLPEFCQKMLAVADTAQLCTEDGVHRGSAPYTAGRVVCHAGRMVGRRRISLQPVGELDLFYGARPAQPAPLETTAAASATSEAVQREDAVLDAIAGAIASLFGSTVLADALAIALAHELAMSLVATGLTARMLAGRLAVGNTVEDADRYYAQSLESGARLAMYLVRNYLSHMSEHAYGEAVESRRSRHRLREVVGEVVQLHRAAAERKGVTIDFQDGVDAEVSVVVEELERAIHNVVSNAVKYSFRGVPGAQRVVKVKTERHDREFDNVAVVIENYGIPITEQERPLVVRAGFRGARARSEVPIGSGIGLSEVVKIMRHHGGRLRVRSGVAHVDAVGLPVAVTEVKLVLPVVGRKG